MKSWHWSAKLLLALVVLAFLYWQWPTPWRVYSLKGHPIRVNRFTGEAQELWTTGWHTRKDGERAGGEKAPSS